MSLADWFVPGTDDDDVVESGGGGGAGAGGGAGDGRGDVSVSVSGRWYLAVVLDGE